MIRLTGPGGPRLVFSLLLVSLAAPAAAQQPDTAAAQREHVVRQGDTLWDLADHYLRDPFQWPRIFDLNRGIIRDPDLIYPDQRFVLPGGLFAAEGPALLGTPLVDWVWQPRRDSEAEVAEVAVVEPEGMTDTLTVDLRRPVISETEYRATPWMARPLNVAWAGRVARVADPGAQLDRLPSMLREFQQVHVSDLQGSLLEGDSLLVVRVHDSVDEYGQIIRPVGLLRVDSVGADVAVATVMELYEVAREGAMVVFPGAMPNVPLGEASLWRAGVSAGAGAGASASAGAGESPSPSSDLVAGEIIDWLDEEIIHGTPDVAFVNLGEGEVRLGDELEVYMPPRRIGGRGDVVPEELVGRVQVIRIAGPVATVRVISVENTAMGRGLPVRLVARVQ